MEAVVILDDRTTGFLYNNQKDELDTGMYIETLPDGEVVPLNSYVLRNGTTVHERAFKTTIIKGVAHIQCELVDDSGSPVVT